MIDTITYTGFLALLPPERWLKGWRGWKPEGEDARPLSGYERIIKHSLFGIRLFVRAGMVVKVEADLPKLLYGHNGRLIKTQAELDCAFTRLKQALGTICHPVGPSIGWYPGDVAGDTRTFYTRIDLVWQFDLAAAFVFAALRNAKHPEIHKHKGEWHDETLVFPGTKMRISIYDKKLKERAKCDHNVLRFEVQFHGEKIDQHFAVAENNVFQRLLIDIAYAAYRSVLLGFGSDLIPDPAHMGTVVDYVALVAARYPDDDPVSLYCLTRKMCERRNRDFRKAVGKRVPRLVHFSWANLLPEGHLPAVVEIVNEGSERKIDALFQELAPAAASAAP